MRWRLNDEVPIPADAHPSRNPGLELTGPWHPLDMAFNALNSAAPMNMPDFEDASPPHFEPDGTPKHQPVGVFAALQNAKDIFEGRWTDRSYEVVKKGQRRTYTINKPPAQWPTRFVRPPGIHVRFDHITVGGEPVPGVIAIVVLWVLNNYDALARLGTGVYFYIPKLQTPQEALVIEQLLSRLEDMIGVARRDVQDQGPVRRRQCRPVPSGNRVGPAAEAARDERRALGLPGQPDRDVEGRSDGRLSGSADRSAWRRRT